MTYEEYLGFKDKVMSMENQEGYNYLKDNLTEIDFEDYCEWSKIDSENNEVGSLKYYDCNKCKNKGYISKFTRTKENKIMEFLVDCECKTKRKIYKNLYECGIHLSIFKDYSFDNYIANEGWQIECKNGALKFAENCIKNRDKDCDKIENKWFIISGISGSGKSHLCTAIFGKLIKAGYDCKYMSWKDEIVNLKANKKSSYYDNQEQFENDLKVLKEIDILYIDDFLKNIGIGYEMQQDLDLAYQIINSRYLANKITIISSELSKKEIDNLDKAICGRIAEKGMWLQIKNDENRNYRMNGDK